MGWVIHYTIGCLFVVAFIFPGNTQEDQFPYRAVQDLILLKGSSGVDGLFSLKRIQIPPQIEF